jgi:protein-tyrosine phosphatase
MAIVPRPRGGDWLDLELAAIKKAGVNVLVSMLPREEACELGLADESAICLASGMTYLCFPIEDRGVPSSTASFKGFVEQLRGELHSGRSVAVHCRASIGRSSLLLGAVLCREGFSTADALHRISQARGLQVPDTQEQVLWLEKFAAHA